MFGQGGVQGETTNIPPNAGSGSPSGGSGSNPANLQIPFPHLYTQEMVQTHLLGCSEEVARFISIAADHYAKAVCNVD